VAPLIYLFEDDATLRELLTEVVRDELAGEVVSFASVAELRERCVDGRPDLIVADFWGASHLTLADAERSEVSELAALAPLILVSARAWARDVDNSELGLVALVPKPLDMDGFLKVLHAALEGAGQPDPDAEAAEQAVALPPRDTLNVFIFGSP
jgi:DNA-binding NtrC family response regulator